MQGEMMSRFGGMLVRIAVCALPALLAWGLIEVPTARLVAEEPAVAVTRRLARPIGLAYLHAAQRLLVANRDSGTITTIHPQTRQVVSTWPIPGAEQLADFIVSQDGQYLLTCSTTQNRVWLLKRLNDQEFAVLETLSVPIGPVGLSWLPAGTTLNGEVTISCQWARKIVFVKVAPEAAPGSRLIVRQSVSVPHAPRRMLPVQDGARLLVADAFGGSISVIKCDGGILERTKQLPGHNLHGLGMMSDNRRVIVAHQILNPVAETSHDGVFWGIVMTNNLRLIPLENFLTDSREPLEDADIHFLGETKHGAADPTSVTVGRFETMLTTLGGVDELAVGVHLDHSFDRIKVGRRPVAVVTDTTGKLAYVANQFSDSVSVIEINTRKVLQEIPLQDTQLTGEMTLAQRGEILFHDASLSLDGWYSCHSCHSSGHTVGLLNDNLGDGNYGAPKRIPSLLGVDATAPYLWSGRRDDLTEQTRKSITTTMHGADPDEGQLKALVAYMRALPPPPRMTTADQAQLARGARVFDSRGCATCHAPPAYTSADVYDVGLKDQHGRTKFNPPSLRGVRYRSPYFHDHRAASLQEVFTKFNHPETAEWPAGDLEDLTAFLESL